MTCRRAAAGLVLHDEVRGRADPTVRGLELIVVEGFELVVLHDRGDCSGDASEILRGTCRPWSTFARDRDRAYRANTHDAQRSPTASHTLTFAHDHATFARWLVDLPPRYMITGWHAAPPEICAFVR